MNRNVDEMHGLLPKLKDLGMDNKYADGHLLIRPELFYYNQGLTVDHAKTTVDKFEKARVLFTLSTRMISEKYISDLFSEAVMTKLKPQIISMHGIDLPPELMHWRESVGIVVKHSVNQTTTVAEQMEILNILTKTEHPPKEKEELECVENKEKEARGRDSVEKPPKLTPLERLKSIARNRGSLNRNDLDNLNRLTLNLTDTASATSSGASSRVPSSKVASGRTTPMAPRASDSSKVTFPLKDMSSSYADTRSVSDSVHTDLRVSVVKETIRDSIEECEPEALPKLGPLDGSENNLSKLASHRTTLVSNQDNESSPRDINENRDGNSKPSDQPDTQDADKGTRYEKTKNHSQLGGLLLSHDGCASIDSGPQFSVRVKNDCSWHSDMETFAEPRTELSFSDSDYEELLREILIEYRCEESSSSEGEGTLKRTHIYYKNEDLVEKNTKAYKMCITNFQKRFVTPGVLDSCTRLSNQLRQSMRGLDSDSRAHEKATFDSNYEAVRARFLEHMIIDVPLPAALADTTPLSISYSGTTTYKSFVFNEHVDGIVVANSVDGSATLYLQPAEDHYLQRAKKTMDKVYSRDTFVKRDYNSYFRPAVSTEGKLGNTSMPALPNHQNKLWNSKVTSDTISDRDGRRARQLHSLSAIPESNDLYCLSFEHDPQQGMSPDVPLNPSRPTPGLTVSMLDPPGPLSSHSPTIPVNTVAGAARAATGAVPAKVLSHSIISANVRAVDTGKVIHRHSILLKSSSGSKSGHATQGFTDEKINAKISELNNSSLFKKPRAQISDAYEAVPTGVAHLCAGTDYSRNAAQPQSTPLGFFAKNAKMRRDKYENSKAEHAILNTWKPTALYGPNLIPFGGSTMKHSAVYVDVRDVVKAQEIVRSQILGTSQSGGQSIYSVKTAPNVSKSNSTTFSKVGKVMSVCGPRVSTSASADWKLENYSK